MTLYPSMSRKITTIVFHHTDTTDMLVDEAAEKISQWHRDDPDLQSELSATGLYVTYHYIIDHTGAYKQTRLDDEIGHHAGNYPINEVSIGIAFIGNFMKTLPTEEAINTAIKISRNLRKTQPITDIWGHKDVRLKPTSCPGTTLYNFLPTLITKIMNNNEQSKSPIRIWADNVGIPTNTPEWICTILNGIFKLIETIYK